MQNWDENNATHFRDFLSTHPHFVEHLKARRPALDKTNIQTTAISAACQEGYETAIKELESMAQGNKPGVEQEPFVNTEED